MQLAPPRDQARTGPGLELVELAAVEDPGEDLPYLDGAEQVVEVVLRWLAEPRWPGQRRVPVPAYADSYGSLQDLLNFYVSVRTHANVRNFLFLDAVLISVDW